MEEPADETQPTPDEDELQRTDDAAIAEQVEALWETLSEIDREIIRLYFFTDPPQEHQAIADALGAGWTANRVQEQLHRLLKRLRTQRDPIEGAEE